MHAHARLLGDLGDHGGLEVLLVRVTQELVHVVRGASATAMRSCDSEMASSVPSRPSYFFGTAFRSMSRPSASSPMATRHAAGAEVVAALDQAARFAVAEQALDLALLGRRCPSAPRHRRCSSDSRLCALERARGAADAVAAGAAAQQHDHVARSGRLAAHVVGRRGAPPPRRSPCAWQRSRGGTARPPGPWPGRSGCRSWSSPRQPW